jgi:hypothetical protein
MCSGFKSGTLRKMIGHNKETFLEDWRKLRNDEFCNFCSSPNIIRMTRSRTRRCVGHVAYMGKRGMYTGFWLGSKKERNQCEKLAEEGRIILKWI